MCSALTIRSVFDYSVLVSRKKFTRGRPPVACVSGQLGKGGSNAR